MQDHNQSQIEALSAAVAACDNCSTACLQEADVQAMSRCITLSRDCADVCALTLRLVARNSEYAASLLKECVQICIACADECGRHDNVHCQQCAEACRRCA